MIDVPVKAVKKALDLLSLLAFEDPELRGTELTVLAQRLGLPANTAHNLLKTMSVCGYVAQNAAGRYITGPQCRRIGLLNLVEGDQFKERLATLMKRCIAEVNEAMVFVTLHGGKRVVLARSEPTQQAIRIDQQVVESSSIYQMPTGRVLVAFATPDDYRRILANYGPPDAVWPDYKNDLVKIRKERQCLLLPDSRGINAFAFPVCGADHRLLGAIGCYTPAFRCDVAAQQKIIAVLRHAADELANP